MAARWAGGDKAPLARILPPRTPPTAPRAPRTPQDAAFLMMIMMMAN